LRKPFRQKRKEIGTGPSETGPGIRPPRPAASLPDKQGWNRRRHPRRINNRFTLRSGPVLRMLSAASSGKNNDAPSQNLAGIADGTTDEIRPTDGGDDPRGDDGLEHSTISTVMRRARLTSKARVEPPTARRICAPSSLPGGVSGHRFDPLFKPPEFRSAWVRVIRARAGNYCQPGEWPARGWRKRTVSDVESPHKAAESPYVLHSIDIGGASGRSDFGCVGDGRDSILPHAVS
jgi:hypothetical protein